MLASEKAELRQAQIQREMTAIERIRGIAASRLEANMDKGRVDCLPYKSKVMRKMVEVTDDVINDILNSSQTNPQFIGYKEIVKELSTKMDLSVVISDFLLAVLVNEPKTFATIGRQLSTRIMKTYQMLSYIKENKYYYEEMARFLSDNRVGSFDGIYDRFVAGVRVDKVDMKLQVETASCIAQGILNKILNHPDSYLNSIIVPIKKKRKHKYIYLSAELMDLMQDIIDNSITNTFDRIPMIVPPIDWHKSGTKYIGGYITPTARQGTPIFSGERHTKFPSDVPQPYLDALNKLQKTPYRVNKYMYKIIKNIFDNNLAIAKVPRSTNIPLTDIPESISEEMDKSLRAERREQHIENMKIFSKSVSLLAAFKQCEELSDQELYFVYSLCYRGRLYCMCNGLTVQGSDMIKSLLHFSQPKEVGERGLYWLKVRAANTLGEDKLEPDDRVAFIDNLIKDGTINKIAEDPLGNRDLWKDADKPLQYLATVHELAIAYKLKDPTKHMSQLPVGLDGSCNGSQHLAVLARDPKLATSVNVLPSDECKDVYQDVVDHIYKHMHDKELIDYLKSKNSSMDDIKHTVKWLLTTFTKPPRKLVKRCVMTLPYGATLHGFMDFIREFIKDYSPERKNKMVVIIMFMVEQALSKTNGGAVRAMKYIQDSARKQAKETGTFKFTTPLGLEVDCFKAKEGEPRELRVLGYKSKITTYTDKPNLAQIESCSAPNFVHSLDACHLINVINRPELTCLQAIHDDIGTYPSDTDKLYEIIRDEFVKLYKDKDYFKDLNDVPFEYGEGFDIELVRKSKHFFL